MVLIKIIDTNNMEYLINPENISYFKKDKNLPGFIKIYYDENYITVRELDPKVQELMKLFEVK